MVVVFLLLFAWYVVADGSTAADDGGPDKGVRNCPDDVVLRCLERTTSAMTSPTLFDLAFLFERSDE